MKFYSALDSTCTENTIRLQLSNDLDGQTTWRFDDSNGNCVQNGTTTYNGGPEIIEFVVDDGCYTLQMRDINIYFQIPSSFSIHPSFDLYLKDVLITLKNQTADDTYMYTAQNLIYFCTHLIDPIFVNSTSRYNYNNSNQTAECHHESSTGNQLTIGMSHYPEHLSLSITNTDSNELMYLNEFGTKAIQNTQYHNQSLVLKHFADGCYIITFHDDSFNAIESSLVKTYYTIMYNGLIVSYGGYYGTSESNHFCTDNTAFCAAPYQCSDLYVSTNSDGSAVIAGYSYKSLYNSIFAADVDCFGAYSCANATLLLGGSFASKSVICMGYNACIGNKDTIYLNTKQIDVLTCDGYRSCSDLNILYPLYGLVSASPTGPSVLYCNGTMSCCDEWNYRGTNEESFGVEYRAQIWYVYGSMVNIAGNLTFMNQTITIYLSGYYSFYKTLIVSHSSPSYIVCVDSNPQFFNPIGLIVSGCGDDYNNESSHIADDVTNTFITKLSEIDKSLNVIESKCQNNHNGSLTFDIGYPLFVNEFIFNSNGYGYICCRGYHSCFGALVVRSTFGHIVCAAVEACKDTFIWNSDDSNRLQEVLPHADAYSNSSSYSYSYSLSYRNTANVYCLSPASCYQSIIKTSSEIYCLAAHSCAKVVVQEAAAIYCTNDACIDSTINHANRVFLIDHQPGATILSDDIGEMMVYIRGENAGQDVVINCNYDDLCTIDCGSNTNNTCKNTIVYCFGKCIVICDDNVSGSCPNIVDSRSPTDAPSSAPSLTPTVNPTDQPSNDPSNVPTNVPTVTPIAVEVFMTQLTEDDIESAMQWALLGICGIVILVVMFGFIDKCCIHDNDRFNYKAIIIFGFYSSDFVSDWFFAAKLMLSINNFIFFVLFFSCVGFIVIPLFANVFQLNREISKWNKDACAEVETDKKNTTNAMHQTHTHDTTTRVRTWIKSRIKLVYFLSFICGSSFSTITLCNSCLYQLNVFSMGLSKKQMAIFQNKRIFSIVCLEV